MTSKSKSVKPGRGRFPVSTGWDRKDPRLTFQTRRLPMPHVTSLEGGETLLTIMAYVSKISLGCHKSVPRALSFLKLEELL